MCSTTRPDFKGSSVARGLEVAVNLDNPDERKMILKDNTLKAIMKEGKYILFDFQKKVAADLIEQIKLDSEVS